MLYLIVSIADLCSLYNFVAVYVLRMSGRYVCLSFAQIGQLKKKSVAILLRGTESNTISENIRI